MRRMSSNFGFGDVRDTEFVYQEYCKDNIEIIDNSAVDSNRCYLFFSGNGLYYPNTEEKFRDKIVRDNRYEWRNLCKNSVLAKKSKKILFIRDIYKQWYVNGCSEKYNTVYKLKIKLAELTDGMEIITIGNSGGGYAAILFGLLLHAKEIYSFSGQFSIWDKMNKDDNIMLTVNQERKYYDLSWLIEQNEGHIPIFWFYAVGSQQDMEQKKIADSLRIYRVAFKESLHGRSCLPSDYIPFIMLELDKKTSSIEGHDLKVYTKLSFSISYFGAKGIINAILYLLKRIRSKE